MVELRLLGPVQMWVAGQPVDLGPPKQRVVLAALAVDPNKPVPMSILVERTWDQAPPTGAHQILYSHLSAIRRTLHRAGGETADQVPAALLRRGGGYLLELEPDRVDAHRFRQLVGQARGPATPPTVQAALLRQALDLWHGPALADLSSAWAGRLRQTWQQQRLAAARLWAEAELQAGEPGAVVEELLTLTAEHPLVEPLVALLMRALHADGRDAEALDTFTAVRRRLAEELGVDPGSGLRDVHQAILQGTLPPRRQAAGQPTTAAPAAAEPRPAPRTINPAPAQLPADVHAFTGRTTELAVHWAHRVRDAFGDGQLYVNLRGYDPDRPLPAADALAGFLTTLGVPGQDIPLDVEDRAARYRTEISGRRMLVVLDNVGTVEQVRPLLPGTPTCAVLVTSRDSLAGLVALHGAHRLELDLLPPDEAVTLLRRLVGARVDAEPDAAATLATHCARLPLALRVAAEIASTRPTTPLADLVDELADQQRRLDLLDAGGDPRAAVRAVFSWSYQRLPADAARAFRLLGLHPGPDCDPYAAAALTGTSVDQAQHILDLLGRAHLIYVTRPGRYGMHDLLRVYATHLAHAEDGQDERRSALTHLFDRYLATASAAMDILYPAEAQYRPRLPPYDSPTPPVANPSSALAWLDTERPNLLAASLHAGAHGWPEHTIRLAATVFRHLDAGGHYPDALTIHTHARHAAGRTGDRAAEAHALNNLAGVHFKQGRHGQAADHLQQALALFRQIGEHVGEMRALNNLGFVYWRQGRYQQAADLHRQALAFYRQTGDRDHQADALSGLGLVDGRLGRYRQAADHHRQALALYRQAGDRVGEALALDNLGAARQRQGRHREAAEHHQQAITLCRQTGHRQGEADALTNLGLVCAKQGRYARATDLVQQALRLYLESGDGVGESAALNGLGEILRGAGHPEQARTQHAAALALAVETSDQYEQARSHAGLAHAHRGTGDLDQARHHLGQALTLYTDLGAPDADDVRAHLISLDRPAAAKPMETHRPGSRAR